MTTREVQDALPVVPGSTLAPSGPAEAQPSNSNRVISGGMFITHEHQTSGTAQLIALGDGRRQLLLRDLATSDGPDLRVWLTDQAVVPGRAGWKVFDDGRWVELAPLKGNRGNQAYDIPADVDIAGLRSVSIWCRRFAVSFGAAALNPA